jgi:hypothetical protein
LSDKVITTPTEFICFLLIHIFLNHKVTQRTSQRHTKESYGIKVPLSYKERVRERSLTERGPGGEALSLFYKLSRRHHPSYPAGQHIETFGQR